MSLDEYEALKATIRKERPSFTEYEVGMMAAAYDNVQIEIRFDKKILKKKKPKEVRIVE